MINGAGKVIYSFGNVGRGVGPCRLQVTSGGQVAIIDSLNVVWSINGAPVQPSNGQIAVGQQLQQVRPLLHSLSAPLEHRRACLAGRPVACGGQACSHSARCS